jgi:hypothetical protein
MGAATGRPLRTDDATTLNVRLVLKTKDEALIGMTYSAIRHGPPDVVAKIEKGEVVDPTSYYFRIRQRPSAGGRADLQHLRSPLSGATHTAHGPNSS